MTTDAAFDQTLALLKAKDDTSRFVGLSLLRSLLDTHEDVRSNPDIVSKCWSAIPAKFLTRLLQARQNEKRSAEEAQAMVQLAVGVIHTFIILLPAKDLEGEKMVSVCRILAREYLHRVVLERPTAQARRDCMLLAADLLRTLPPGPSTLKLIFAAEPSEDSSKPFAYVFTSYVLIDIRSTIPSLMEILASKSYSDTAIRLAAGYDILGAFISYLVQSLDDEADEDGKEPAAVLQPDLLLKLRKDIAETMSLTIEYIRDRWDAAKAGAAGLHPSIRPSPDKKQPEGSDTPLALAWENPTIPVTGDPIIIAGLRTLAIWLREDENDSLRKEAAGIMDVLLALYSNSGIEALDVTASDFRLTVLMALEAILETEDGVQAFLENGGKAALTSDLQRLSSESTLAEADQQVVDMIEGLLAAIPAT